MERQMIRTPRHDGRPHNDLCTTQVDLEAVFVREGDAPVRQLQAALSDTSNAIAVNAQDSSNAVNAHETCSNGGNVSASSAVGCSGEELAALQQALQGVVWTRSMRRMYTLVDR